MLNLISSRKDKRNRTTIVDATRFVIGVANVVLAVVDAAVIIVVVVVVCVADVVIVDVVVLCCAAIVIESRD